MYTRIASLPDNVQELGVPELSALSEVWQERKSDLEQNDAYLEFIKKLQREWAVETGIIERLYNWERGVTEVLIEQGIDSALIAYHGGLRPDKAEDVTNLINDQRAIVEELFSFVKDERPFSEHFIRGMHAQFTTHQEYTDALTLDGDAIRVPLLRGAYKKWPNNPSRSNGVVHQYCPPEIVQEEMERLVSWYQQAPADTPVEVLSAWLHHRFTQIHPFQDGNGRVARALASLVFLKARVFPLVIRGSDRQVYIDALEKADKGDITSLVNLFAKRQKDSILRAIGLEQQVQQEGHAEQIISAAVQILRDRVAADTQRQKAVFAVADRLLEMAVDRLTAIQLYLQTKLGSVQDNYSSWVNHAKANDQKNYYYWGQIVETAKEFDYFANLEGHKSWCSLKIDTKGSFEIVVSFHGYGRQFNGILVASAFTAQRISSEDGRTEPVNTGPATTDLFQFNYAEPVESTEKRFKEWLESVIAIALEQWRRTINT